MRTARLISEGFRQFLFVHLGQGFFLGCGGATLGADGLSQGLDLIGIQDHPYNPDLLDTWTLLSHLAAATTTIRPGRRSGRSRS